MAKEKGLNLETTKVGDRYVLERMKEIGAFSWWRTVRSYYFP